MSSNLLFVAGTLLGDVATHTFPTEKRTLRRSNAVRRSCRSQSPSSSSSTRSASLSPKLQPATEDEDADEDVPLALLMPRIIKQVPVYF